MNEKPFAIIYKATNIINQKVYIGQTKRDLRIRKIEHKSHSKNGSKMRFNLAIQEYGFNNFDWEVLKLCYSKTEANLSEVHFVSFYQSTDVEKGYNLEDGGWDSKRHIETIEKIKRAHTGKKLSTEVKEKIGLSNKGKKMSIEAKEKIRLSRIGKKQSNEFKEKMSKRIICNETGVIFESISKAEKTLGLTNISSHLGGRRKHIKNYTFKLL
jgi:group I intron endonuclease